MSLTIVLTTVIVGEISSLVQDQDVIITTNVSALYLTTELRLKEKKVFDLVIYDEAHHYAGEDKKNHDLLQIKAGAKLFMTATPKVLAGDKTEDLKEKLLTRIQFTEADKSHHL